MRAVVHVHDLRGLVRALLGSSLSPTWAPAASRAWLAGAVCVVQLADLAPVGAWRGRRSTGLVGASLAPTT